MRTAQYINFASGRNYKYLIMKRSYLRGTQRKRIVKSNIVQNAKKELAQIEYCANSKSQKSIINAPFPLENPRERAAQSAIAQTKS